MQRNQRIEKLQGLTKGKVSPSIQRSKKNKLSKKGRKWIVEIALIAKRQLRFQNKTQKQLAEEMGVSAQQVNKWLSGKENFTIDTVAQLSEVLGVDLLKANLVLAEQEPNEVRNNVVFLKPNTELTTINKKSYQPKVIPMYGNIYSERALYNS